MTTLRLPKKVRFILAWQTYRVGDVITPNGTLRDWLIGNGYCKLVDEPVHVATNEPANTVARPMSQRVRGVMTRAKAA